MHAKEGSGYAVRMRLDASETEHAALTFLRQLAAVVPKGEELPVYRLLQDRLSPRATRQEITDLLDAWHVGVPWVVDAVADALALWSLSFDVVPEDHEARSRIPLPRRFKDIGTESSVFVDPDVPGRISKTDDDSYVWQPPPMPLDTADPERWLRDARRGFTEAARRVVGAMSRPPGRPWEHLERDVAIFVRWQVGGESQEYLARSYLISLFDDDNRIAGICRRVSEAIEIPRRTATECSPVQG